MNWGTRGWAAILCALIALTGAHAQPTRPSQAQLGTPGTPPLPAAPILAEMPPSETTSPAPRLPETRILPVAAQGRPSSDDDDVFSSLIQLAPPGPQRLFRIESEKELFERIRIERRVLRLPMELPPMAEKTPSQVLPPRLWNTLAAVAEPCYLCYRRTPFEQRAFERYGWNIGIIQPPISALVFYADLLTLPVNWALDPFRDFECNAGLCLPGDPTPLMWYRRVK